MKTTMQPITALLVLPLLTIVVLVAMLHLACRGWWWGRRQWRRLSKEGGAR